MGQKVNPILFRLGSQKKENPSFVSPVRKPHFSHFLFQEIEIKKFLFLLLRSRGVLLRSCTLHRTSEKLLLDLDLYFTSVFFKESKLVWARSFFKNMKKKHFTLKKVKDLKGFLNTVSSLDGRVEKKTLLLKKKHFLPRKKKKLLFRIRKAKKYFFKKNRKKRFHDFDLVYKRRLFYYLMHQKKKDAFPEEKETIYTVNQNHVKPGSSLVKLRMKKLNKLFSLRKFKYSFSRLLLKNFLSRKKTKKKKLLELNKMLCQSLQNYCGIEEVTIRFSSAQLLLLPSFKFYKKFLLRELFSFRRNRDLKRYFIETVELFYFVLRSFGKGNASLLGRFIAHLLEKNRKQLFIVKFLKKCLELFFNKVPNAFLAVEGIRILLKGRFNKRRRSKKIVLSQGEISLQTLDTPIDYFQTKAITIYGCFGIKIWIARRKD